MATEQRIVVPADIGKTIELSTTEQEISGTLKLMARRCKSERGSSPHLVQVA